MFDKFLENLDDSLSFDHKIIKKDQLTKKLQLSQDYQPPWERIFLLGKYFPKIGDMAKKCIGNVSGGSREVIS